MNEKNNLLNSFLVLYFYKIEQELNKAQRDFEKIKFQSEESNTDEYLKKYIQKFLLAHNTLANLNINYLSIEIDGVEHSVRTEEFKDFAISNVFLPEELKSEQKKMISELKQSVYTNPDLYLEIKSGKNVYYESLELKSTKDNNIPGSSIQQIVPYEWVIFIKRNADSVSVSTGYYINSVTEKIQFPDRSPRPQVGFKTLFEWNKKNRTIHNNILVYRRFTDIENNKIKLLTNWQEYLASEWLEIVKCENITNNEKWFNNAIRIFVLKFLDFTENLSEIEKEKFKEQLSSLIK